MPKSKEPAEPTPAEPGTTEPATPPTGEPAVTPESIELPEGYELIRTEDKNNIIAARDKANAGNSDMETVVSGIMQDNAIRDAVASDEFKKNYPDVSKEDLTKANPESVEQIEEVAKELQARYETIKQNHLKSVQVAGQPEITAADRKTQLEALRKPSNKSRFGQAFRLMSMRTKQ